MNSKIINFAIVGLIIGALIGYMVPAQGGWLWVALLGGIAGYLAGWVWSSRTKA